MTARVKDVESEVQQISPAVRRALPGEEVELAAVAAALFRQGYAVTHPEPELSRYVARCLSVETFARDLMDPRVTVRVVEEGPTGPLVGYAILRDGSPAVGLTSRVGNGNRPLEIVRFYVDQKWHGSGVAQTLMTDCVLEAVRRGSEVLWLQVWQKAARALAFYKKMGFVVCGTAKFEFGPRVDDDFLLVRPAVPRAAGVA